MNPTTKDEIKGIAHEVKGKVKEKAGQVTNNPNSELKAKPNASLAQSEKRPGRSKKCSRSKLVGLWSGRGRAERKKQWEKHDNTNAEPQAYSST